MFVSRVRLFASPSVNCVCYILIFYKNLTPHPLSPPSLPFVPSLFTPILSPLSLFLSPPCPLPSSPSYFDSFFSQICFKTILFTLLFVGIVLFFLVHSISFCLSGCRLPVCLKSMPSTSSLFPSLSLFLSLSLSLSLAKFSNNVYGQPSFPGYAANVMCYGICSMLHHI